MASEDFQIKCAEWIDTIGRIDKEMRAVTDERGLAMDMGLNDTMKSFAKELDDLRVSRGLPLIFKSISESLGITNAGGY